MIPRRVRAVPVGFGPQQGRESEVGDAGSGGHLCSARTRRGNQPVARTSGNGRKMSAVVLTLRAVTSGGDPREKPVPAAWRAMIEHWLTHLAAGGCSAYSATPQWPTTQRYVLRPDDALRRAARLAA